MAGVRRIWEYGVAQPTLVRLLGAILGLGTVLVALPLKASLAQSACGENCDNLLTHGATAASSLTGPLHAEYADARFPQTAPWPSRRLTVAPHVAQRTRTVQPAAGQFVREKVVISQIHNAPGWRPSHTYTYHTGPYTRVVNGPGWNAGAQTYNPGLTLNAYQLISRGSCISARRSGPTGTKSDIIDGTCRWRYLSSVDYISITGWAFDSPHWRIGPYSYGVYMTSDSPLRAYEQVNPSGCKSSIAPTGTAAGSGTTFTTSDACQWTYWADIIYSSEKSYIPTEHYAAGPNSKVTDRSTDNYQADLWNDREYIAGRNDEAVPIRLQAHFDYTKDGFPYSAESGNLVCAISPCPHIIITTAPGESFADSTTSTDPLTGFNPSKGVAILNPTSGALTDGLELRDNNVDLIGLQIKSSHGIGLGGGETHGGNSVVVDDSIVDGGHGTNNPAIDLDTSMLVANSLVVAHGPLGIEEDYPGTILHSTLVNPDRIPNSIGIEVGLDWKFQGETVSNTAIFGFAHVAGSTGNSSATGWRGMTWLGGHNATDAPAGDNGSLGLGRAGTATARILPGTTYGESARAAFVAFPGDYRLREGSPLIGAGNALGPFNPACLTGKPCPALYTLDSPDIVGTPRPQAGRYDIGAWQSKPVPLRAASVPPKQSSPASTAVP